jgi:hypothetical protein
MANFFQQKPAATPTKASLVEINNGFTRASECGIDAFLPSSREPRSLSLSLSCILLSSAAEKAFLPGKINIAGVDFGLSKKNSNRCYTGKGIILSLALYETGSLFIF